jgi:hypothetical protein
MRLLRWSRRIKDSDVTRCSAVCFPPSFQLGMPAELLTESKPFGFYPKTTPNNRLFNGCLNTGLVGIPFLKRPQPAYLR